MFKVNDVIIYSAQGVCKIVDVEEKNVSGKKKKYYVLKPVKDNGATVFVPTDNELALKKMRRLLTKDEIYSLIDSMPAEKPAWIPNDNERKERFRAILVGGNHSELIQMIKAIYSRKKEREAEGKRLHMSDESFFREAEQALYNEFEYVLDLKSKDDLLAYIAGRVEGTA